jgi:hypothetical protein
MSAVGDPRLPRIVVPMTVLATLDGHDVTLLTVELWPDRVRLRMCVEQDEETDRLDATHDTDFEAWGNAVDRADREHPQMPGSAFFTRMRFALSDEEGTAYERRFGSTAGSGSEWLAEWVFFPAAPGTVDRLLVTAEGPWGARTSEVALR